EINCAQAAAGLLLANDCQMGGRSLDQYSFATSAEQIVAFRADSLLPLLLTVTDQQFLSGSWSEGRTPEIERRTTPGSPLQVMVRPHAADTEAAYTLDTTACREPGPCVKRRRSSRRP
ncbi:MAG TPA: hypothetical protein VM534_07570, partial [Thermoanaerobaculia bacterium]|nr:hypothetical protein [Thermoanaerobaculia bacterium]